jgi:hypothetical protein
MTSWVYASFLELSFALGRYQSDDNCIVETAVSGETGNKLHLAISHMICYICITSIQPLYLHIYIKLKKSSTSMFRDITALIRWKSTNRRVLRTYHLHLHFRRLSRARNQRERRCKQSNGIIAVSSRNDVKTHQAFHSQPIFSLSLRVITGSSSRLWNAFFRVVIQCSVCYCFEISKVFPSIWSGLRQPIRCSRKTEPLLLTEMSLGAIRRDRQVTSLQRAR